MTYTIQIPLQATIEIEVDAELGTSYAEMLSSITEVDLKEAALQIPSEEINKSFIRSVAQNSLKVQAA